MKTPDSPQQTYASVEVPDLGVEAKQCVAPKVMDPCSIVIIGATGDLTARKLIPSFFSLFLNDGMPEPFLIIGCGRTTWDDDEFRGRMQSALQKAESYDDKKWQDFSTRLHYRTIDYEQLPTYEHLAADWKVLDRQARTAGNRIFYVALPPGLYKTVARMLGKAGLSSEDRETGGWARIVVEKPFGTDLNSAIELDRSLHEHFKEHQIFRIDHYLAKENVQNILMFRFANSLFEPLWNRRYIDHVAITATETLGVEHRAGYYEQAGVLRDMFQNHMMQLLALTAMEPPSRFEANLVRDERVKVFRALRALSPESIDDQLVLGQYAAGNIEGQPVSAYREEANVAPDSLTPTYAMMKVYLDNWRWQGVPFFLTSGKRMAKKLTEIAIQFKTVPHSMFRHILGEAIVANRLTLGIYPEEKITLSFQTKNPGALVCLRTVTMDFHYHQNYSGPILEAYAKVLMDCMLGDQMLFWRQDGVERSWSFLTPILQECESCDDRDARLHLYDAGSGGPAAANKLFADVDDNRRRIESSQ